MIKKVGKNELKCVIDELLTIEMMKHVVETYMYVKYINGKHICI